MTIFSTIAQELLAPLAPLRQGGIVVRALSDRPTSAMAGEDAIDGQDEKLPGIITLAHRSSKFTPISSKQGDISQVETMTWLFDIRMNRVLGGKGAWHVAQYAKLQMLGLKLSLTIAPVQLEELRYVPGKDGSDRYVWELEVSIQVVLLKEFTSDLADPLLRSVCGELAAVNGELVEPPQETLLAGEEL